jgi:hypothetical protein
MGSSSSRGWIGPWAWLPVLATAAQPTRAEHLLCYKAKRSAGSSPFVKQIGVVLGNQFGAETVDAISLGEVCVPSTVVDLP